MDSRTADKITTEYRKLRKECFRIFREHPELMGNDAWLLFAIGQEELELYPAYDGIVCSGYTYSFQSQSKEYFNFTIPYDRIRL